MTKPRRHPPEARWEHFEHGADIGVRGLAPTKAEAFEQCARSLIAAIADVTSIHGDDCVEIACSAPDDELLLVEWLNELIYEMSVRRLVFGRFEVAIADHSLTAKAWGEPVGHLRHAPAVEPKGATYTALEVVQQPDGTWHAQCVVDV
jgi:SHS2 domain-containing protein